MDLHQCLQLIKINNVLIDEELTIEQKLSKLIRKCNVRGGNDNISIAYLEIEDMESGDKE